MDGSIRTQHGDDGKRDARSERDAKTQRLLHAATQVACPRERQRLRDEAAALNRDLALGVAFAFHGRGMDAEDIDQVALLGLWKALGIEFIVNLDQHAPSLRFTRKFWEHYLSYVIRGKEIFFEFEVIK